MSALRGLGTNGADAIPAVLRALNDTDNTVATAAVTTLGMLRGAPEQVLPALVRCFNDPRPGLRSQALRVVGSYENEASNVLASVVEKLEDPVKTVRNAAVAATCQIHRCPVPFLISELSHSAPLVRESAAHGLQLYARRNTNAFNALTNLLSDENPDVQKQAATALKSIDRMRATRMKVP